MIAILVEVFERRCFFRLVLVVLVMLGLLIGDSTDCTSSARFNSISTTS